MMSARKKPRGAWVAEIVWDYEPGGVEAVFATKAAARRWVVKNRRAEIASAKAGDCPDIASAMNREHVREDGELIAWRQFCAGWWAFADTTGGHHE